MAKGKSVITVVGKDRVGIIARICTYLADSNINILDISQTIVSGFFNMMMIVDTEYMERDFNSVSADLEEIGKDLGVIVKLQREEIFDIMQRI
ncbi:MAG: ACT domain-containing protein [Candidatus Ornithospirochaeta sp.]|nr:ACT domain-containing protein [Candidatus Ornithospirochaeta sp.]